MTSKEFERRYSDRGGFAKLCELKSLLYTYEAIAEHFRVSKTSVRSWMKDLFETYYDSRKERREITVNNMVEFARTHQFKEFRYTFRKSSYYKPALERCKELKIYG